MLLVDSVHRNDEHVERRPREEGSLPRRVLLLAAAVVEERFELVAALILILIIIGAQGYALEVEVDGALVLRLPRFRAARDGVAKARRSGLSHA